MKMADVSKSIDRYHDLQYVKRKLVSLKSNDFYAAIMIIDKCLEEITQPFYKSCDDYEEL